jgi:hypothetical protein
MMSVLTLLRQSGKLYRQHFALFAGYAAWLLLPEAGFILWYIGGATESLDFLIALFLVLQAFLSVWVTFLIALITQEVTLNKKPVELPRLHATLKRVFPSALFVALIETAVVLGGLLLFIIPGLMFSVWFMFSTIAALLDGKRGMEAITFSRELVRGRFWRTARFGLIGPLIIFLCYLFATNLIITLLSVMGRVPLETLTVNPPALWIDVVRFLGEVFTLPWLVTYGTLLYLHTRETRKTPVELAASSPLA